jgi:dipeptidyl aminopeptidase/acylaminoacyl peptidase
MLTQEKTSTRRPSVSPLSIAGLRRRKYHAELSLEKEFEGYEKGFRSFLVSYPSDGLKVFARINIPEGKVPGQGFPVIVFAHGFSPNPQDPDYFQRPYYETWLNAYSQAGFIVIMPGYRGHGLIDSKRAEGGDTIDKYADLFLTSPFYAVDVLNLVADLPAISCLDWEKYGLQRPSKKLVDNNNLFLAAHSMGGEVALMILAVKDCFNAASIWAGVTASLEDVARFYTQYEIAATKSKVPFEIVFREKWRKISIAAKAAPFQLDNFNAWNGLFSLQNLTTPVLIHHGTGDTSVPVEWSLQLDAELKNMGKESTLFLYKGNNHELSLKDENIAALERDVIYFRKHFKK